jgi:macrolide-specific efflux system membrane fusion protein
MWKAHEAFDADALDTELSVDDPIFIQRQREWLAAEASFKNQQQVVAQQQASLNSASQNYQQYASVITAPTGGTVKGLNVAEGMVLTSSSADTDTAGASQVIATIGSDSKPIISVTVTEVDVSKIKTGQKANVTFDGLPDDSFVGTVVGIDRVGSATSGVTQYPILLQLDTVSDSILPNMAATADIILESKPSVLQIPIAALNTQGENITVQVFKDGQYQTITVETGLETDTMVEITSGLAVGDQVVTNTVSSQSQENTQSTQGGPAGFSLGGGAFSGRP